MPILSMRNLMASFICALCFFLTSTLLAQGIATRRVSSAPRANFSGKSWAAKFTDVSDKAGLTPRTTYGGVDRIDYIIETSGGGLAAIDVDRDGWLDVFVMDGPGGHHRLYRNQTNGTFKEVAKFASEWGHGRGARRL